MSDLDRLIALAGLATNDVAEACNETKMICKDCGDELGNPTTNCPHDSQDPSGEHWVDVDIDGDGDADLKVNMEGADCDCDCGESPCEACGETHHDVAEAVGEKAESFYDMQDAFAGGEAEGAHKVIIDELVRYLSGDQLEDFVADFSRHYDLADMDMNEDDLDENAFNQAAAAAARAGKEEFEFGGKTYKTKMDKSTAHKLDDDVQMESAEINFTPEEEKRIEMYDLEAEMSASEYEETKAWAEQNLDSGIASDIKEMMQTAMQTKEVPVDDALQDFGDDFETVHLFGSDALIQAYDSVREAAGEEDDVEGFIAACKQALGMIGMSEEVVEAPTIDTTQLITLLKNAGLTEEAIEEKLTEWANTPAPEMAGEQEPTEHGEAYEFAQSVNLSLKRYLDAEDMKVGLKEHKVEDIREAYEAKKNK